jgi:uncharacterized membrane protein
MTIINHTYGFVFIHIPKNAGSSTANYLSQLSAYRDQEVGVTRVGELVAPALRSRYLLHKHATHSEIKTVMGRDDISSYATIAVVRHPYERAYSAYTFLQQWDGWRRNERFADLAERLGRKRRFRRGWDFDEFVASRLIETSGP